MRAAVELGRVLLATWLLIFAYWVRRMSLRVLPAKHRPEVFSGRGRPPAAPRGTGNAALELRDDRH